MTSIEITSFGYLHGAPPDGAHLTLDLRHHFRDPHINPALREMTAHDPQVRVAVIDTPGITSLIGATVSAVEAFASGPRQGPVRVAVGCAGGRHRAATVAMVLAHRLTRPGNTVTLTHLDLGKAVVHR
ncbi:RNase adapter RapZ [Kitasatospora sp. NBC_00070]|uniref:RapZ C-terminal domain-containing protein n=1 Tax=Kitasatospora sp. NBC_00070 TaxID=2975962 RepID=UPI0032536795